MTGGAGRLGRAVVKALEVYHDVVSVDIIDSDSPRAFCHDVLDFHAISAVVAGADVVVHLAALDYDAHAPAVEVVRVNALGTWTVLQACIKEGVKRAIVCSSVAALGLHECRTNSPPLSLPVRESHAAFPSESYSASKLATEVLAESVVRSGVMDVLCIRPVAIMFANAVEGFLSTVNESSPSLFDYVVAEDVAHAVLLAVAGRWSGYECVLLSAADSAHPDPTLEWYKRLVGPIPRDTDQRLYAVNPRASIYSSERARTLLGWEATTNFLSICDDLSKRSL